MYKGNKMTENVTDVIQSITLSQVLIAILEDQGEVTVPTLKFFDANMGNKELVINYDETGPSLKFSLRVKDEQ
jgi:hypothetical protein